MHSLNFFSLGFFHLITHKPPTSHWGIAEISRIPFVGIDKDLFLLRCGFMILRDQLSPICLAIEAISPEICEFSLCCCTLGVMLRIVIVNVYHLVNLQKQTYKDI